MGALRPLARACARRPVAVIAAWLVLAAGLHATSMQVRSTSGDEASIPGTDSARAAELTRGAFPGDAGTGSPLVLHGALDRAMLAGVDRTLETTPKVAEASAPRLSGDGRTAVISVQLSAPPSELTHEQAQGVLDAARAAAGPSVQVEAAGPLGSKLSRSEVRTSELVGLAAAVLVLLLAFGTVPAMALPIATAVIGVVVALSVIRLTGALTSVPQVAPTLATMIGLGVGIDYALFLVTRVRAERRAGRPLAEAIAVGTAASGTAVVFAGVTVIVALGSLSVAGLDLVTKLGWTAATAVVVAVLAAVTLLPAALALLGDRIEALAVRRAAADTLGQSPAWRRWGETVARRPWRALIAGLVVMLALATPAVGLQLGPESPGSKDPSTTARQAHDLIASAFGEGAAGPLLVVLALDPATGDAELARLREDLEETPGVAVVSPPRVASGGRVATLQLDPATGPADPATEELVRRLREETLPRSGLEAHVGGATAAQVDLAARIGAKLPAIIATVVGLSFVLLVLAFRSIVLPLKAAAMNLLSVAAAYGVLTAVFQHGWGAGLIGLDGPVPVVSYVPMLLFAILFGLSMDYEVFLLSRVQEHHLAGADSRRSVVAGLAATGRIITAAALIMVGVFASFVLVDDPTIKMFGLGLATAIALDATVVRCLLVPATMLLLGRRNWWLPHWLARRLPVVTVEAGAR